MLEFLSGPLVWVAFAGFLGGSLYRLITMALAARRERVVWPTMNVRFGLRSVLHWVVPYRNRVTRGRPLFTAISFGFHACVVLTPLLAMGHAALWQESWGIHWWSLPPALIDVMTGMVIVGGAVFLLRRIAYPEVRRITSWKDVLILLLVISPFVTGFVAHHQWLHHDAVMVLHILSGVAWLIAIPFTRLSHMLWFLFTRAYMGSEFGAVRHARDW